ncbi:hypothetical protein JQ600_09430 [Bradyrhizobium sp. AUGA SZCCT0176]|nr:hypothetical protein [Bradyrhizobium sp. AUGA SZCCT0176]
MWIRFGHRHFVTFSVVVQELLWARVGLKQRASRSHPAVAGFSWTDRLGRTNLFAGRRQGYNRNAAPRIALLSDTNSGMLRLLAKADGFAVISSNLGIVRPGDRVDWFSL